MGWFSNRAQSSRDYPAAGASVTGDSSRFRRHKTSGARKAGQDAERWEQADRARSKRGGLFFTDWRS